MSEENTTNNMVTALKEAYVRLVTSALEGASGDIIAYTAALTQEYGIYLLRYYRDGDEEAHRNLSHLKAQIMLIAVKRQIAAAKELFDELMKITEIAVSIGIQVLIAAAKAA